MAAVLLKNIHKQFATQVVFDDLSLELFAGEIVGLVGPNGCGKTTLLRMIHGQLEPDRGSVERARGARFGYLPQEPEIAAGRSLHQEVASTFEHLLELEQDIHDVSEQLAQAQEGAQYQELSTRYDRLSTRFASQGGYTFTHEMHEILGGLGFARSDHDLPMSALSGGQKCRAALAKLLLSKSDFLLLDEPTNHLDIDACLWLERFLNNCNAGALIVSHDRYLLDRVVDRIVEVSAKTARAYRGNYSNFVKATTALQVAQQRQYEKDKVFIEKEQEFVEKNIASQRGKEARGRRARLERRLRDGEFVTDAVQAQRQVRFQFKPLASAGGPALSVRGLGKQFDGPALFTDLNLQVESGERFAITGPNGSGKTTLLKIVLGQLNADGGEVEFGYQISPGYYAQEAAELQGEHTVLEFLEEACPAAEVTLRTLLGGFEFRGDDVFKTVQSLSGGEQSRLRLLKLILSQPSMLILDEPTNHLDIGSREALEEALSAFPGAILVVSHDRYFLDRIAHRLMVMRPGDCRVFGGNYTHYIEQIERESEAARQQQRERNKQARRDAPRRPQQQESPFQRMTTEEIEQFIADHEQRMAALHEQFADGDVYRDPQRLSNLHAEFDRLRQDLADAEQHWLERAE